MNLSFKKFKTKIKPITILLFMLTFLWTSFIIWNASRTGEQSKVFSDSISESIKDKIENDNHVPPLLEGTGAIYSKDPQSEEAGKVSVNMYQLNIFIRKTGHLIEYTILAFLASLFFASNGMNKDKAFLFTFSFGTIVASADETIQFYTHGRSGRITDVFIDMCGCLMGVFYALCVFMIVYYLIKQMRTTDN